MIPDRVAGQVPDQNLADDSFEAPEVMVEDTGHSTVMISAEDLGSAWAAQREMWETP